MVPEGMERVSFQGLNAGRNVQVSLSCQCSGRKHVMWDLPPKNLMGLPWRIAFALQDDGWYLRSAIVWHKPNPMPESVRDRPTSAYENVFLLTKQPRYFYDAEAIREAHISHRERLHTEYTKMPPIYWIQGPIIGGS